MGVQRSVNLCRRGKSCIWKELVASPGVKVGIEHVREQGCPLYLTGNLFFTMEVIPMGSRGEGGSLCLQVRFAYVGDGFPLRRLYGDCSLLRTVCFNLRFWCGVKPKVPYAQSLLSLVPGKAGEGDCELINT